ncbi:NAD(P)H-binding protein [Pseudomonas sp. Ost2]|uniref:NAD(P)H-binding protein n=1 Tax=Pseudomonas sp. Ost2 TaxID=2678260 RepID=UPI0032AFD5DD
MYAVMGITGQVGGAVARTLLAARQPVRAVVRSAEKGALWAGQGCQVALADVDDVQALTQAFRGVDAVFVMMPSNFDPTRGSPRPGRWWKPCARPWSRRGRGGWSVCRPSGPRPPSRTC